MIVSNSFRITFTNPKVPRQTYQTVYIMCLLGILMVDCMNWASVFYYLLCTCMNFLFWGIQWLHILYTLDTSLTPEEKLEQALAAAQALAPKLPTYLNPGAMNPRKYQTLQEKKKLLWNKKTHEEKSTNKWESVSFGGDDGDKAQAKFRRLMGIGKKRIHPL